MVDIITDFNKTANEILSETKTFKRAEIRYGPKLYKQFMTYFYHVVKLGDLLKRAEPLYGLSQDIKDEFFKVLQCYVDTRYLIDQRIADFQGMKDDEIAYTTTSKGFTFILPDYVEHVRKTLEAFANVIDHWELPIDPYAEDMYRKRYSTLLDFKKILTEKYGEFSKILLRVQEFNGDVLDYMTNYIKKEGIEIS